MSADKSSLFWLTNESWFDMGDDHKFHLTKEAPEEAKKSFDLWRNPPDPTKNGV